MELDYLNKINYDELIKELIKGTDKIFTIKEDILKENLYKYELVRIQGVYNILDRRAINLTGLTEEEYKDIVKRYKKLIKKYPDVRRRAFISLEGIKIATVIKEISICGCNECINKISDILNVNELCCDCKNLAEKIHNKLE